MTGLPRKRATPRRKEHPIRPAGEVVVDRSLEDAELTAAEQRAYERCHARSGCAAQVDPRCTGRNDHAHHRKSRRRGGPTDDVNLLNVCSRCHTWIHGHVDEATTRGFLVPSWADPARWSVLPTHKREHVGWLLWCLSEGYVTAEDRAILTNWLLDPSVLGEHDLALRDALLEMADEVLRA